MFFKANTGSCDGYCCYAYAFSQASPVTRSVGLYYRTMYSYAYCFGSDWSLLYLVRTETTIAQFSVR